MFSTYLCDNPNTNSDYPKTKPYRTQLDISKPLLQQSGCLATKQGLSCWRVCRRPKDLKDNKQRAEVSTFWV